MKRQTALSVIVVILASTMLLGSAFMLYNLMNNTIDLLKERTPTGFVSESFAGK